MASYVITGTARGVGFELTKLLLELPASQVSKVFALTRAEPSAPLQKLFDTYPDRAFHLLASVTDTESVQKAAKDVEAKLGDKGLDVLVNNAAIAGGSPGGIETMAVEQLSEFFDANVLGVQRVTTAFLHLLKKGNQKKVINISTTMGSLAWSKKLMFAPAYAYKISKTALNMLNQQWAWQFADEGFTFLLVSPGWLVTNLGGEKADFPVDVGSKEVFRIMLEATAEQNGKFVNIHVPGHENDFFEYNGKEILF